ncbi:RNA-guided endonuclease InsQ/TnpB family protein [Clostridium tagluense]|uniref:RNA-guided endonuclease InsQ/TnpB family protein n=1 Tax=Clostridium tagluense TaxID=360422 RepID=UPI001C0D85E0|nr:RNA-guided endonuclease TnpB family protein [Clostridium tagluense]MBU3126729.1 transposase [Clostridium tagluense]
MWEYKKVEYKNKYGEYPNEKEMYGKTYRNVVESEMKLIMNTINTANVGQTNAFVMKKWNTDKRDIMNYKKSLANFKLNMPIYIKNSSYKIIKTPTGYEVDCAIFNKSLELKHLTFIIDKLDGNKKSTLNKLMDENYKQGAAQITRDNKGKWNLIISFSFETEKKELDPNRIVGIDVGITNALTMQIWDNNLQEWDRLSWRKCVLDGKELIHYRQKIEARRIALLKNSKVAEENTGKAGHGRTKRIEAISNMSEKVKHFRDTLNHKYSKYVVDFAVKNNCGCIQMENLSGFGENISETLLKNWSYFDLQQKIKYKADEDGIEVNFINPRYTSLRCSSCGNIDKENRDCKNNQAKFECIVCGHKENADINASKNISLPNIEEIIKEQLKTK